jgi:hypothetical protein
MSNGIPLNITLRANPTLLVLACPGPYDRFFQRLRLQQTEKKAEKTAETGDRRLGRAKSREEEETLNN